MQTHYFTTSDVPPKPLTEGKDRKRSKQIDLLKIKICCNSAL